jgi:ribosomal protein L44E
MIAYETQERSDIVRAIIRTIHSCVEEPISGRLTTFDVDYLFTKIRSKSVGEQADLIIQCEECDSENEVQVDLDSIQIDGEIKDGVLQITDDVSLLMKYPTYEEFMNNTKLLDSETQTEGLLELIMACMGSVLTEEEKVDLSDESRESVLEFIDSMTTEQFEKLADFVNSAPAIKQDLEFKCKSCGHDNVRDLKGIDDFF